MLLYTQKWHSFRFPNIKDSSGNWLHDQNSLKEHAVNFYKHLFTKEGKVDSLAHAAAVQQFLWYVPTMISEDENVFLLRPVELSEVRVAI